MEKPKVIDFINEHGTIKFIEYMTELTKYTNFLESEITKLQSTEVAIKWIKTDDVQKLLGVSAGTLQTLRLNGTIQYSKIGGILFYDKMKILKLLEDNETKP